ncbi:MAG TPA: glycosyltransferase family 4 protein [Thermomicrobiales bacterium]|nr:glycosyltransferase family 4 protein [Thermomicrobiales bacterium]
MDKPLRIAQIAPPGIPCPPDGYGASELVAGNLTEELVDWGHDVTLFAHPASVTRAALVSFPRVYDLEDADRRETIHTSLALDYAERFDIIHNHCIRPGPSLIRLARPASLTTLHYVRPILYAFPAAPYAAVSHAQARQLAAGLNIAGVAPNGIDLAAFPVVREKADYLLFLGRIDPKKGVHLAIEAARALDAPLLIAAAHPTPDNRAYFETQVRPGLGGKIEYIGHVGTAEKIRLLGRARCVLMPQQWEEPFGLVAAEALASGTPVVAMRRGALPEIVPDGVAGYLVDGVAEMIDAVSRVGAIRPDDCRNAVEGRYSRAAMTDAYLAIYRRLLDRESAASPAERRALAFDAAAKPPLASTVRSNGATHHR